MFRSKHASHGSKRPSLETLEARNMLSVTPLVPLVQGHAILSADRVSQAIQAVDAQLLTATPSVAETQPISIDLDRDGVLDTITLSQSPGGSRDVLHVLFGGSERHPPFESTMAFEHIVRRLIIADFDGDGRLDLFAQQGESGAGTLLLGRPDGLFDAYRQRGGHFSFAVADLNADGVNDFVYGNDQSAQVKVDRAFGPRQYAGEIGALPPTEVQLADLNADGKPDLAVTEGDGSIEVYAGLGGGQFSSRHQEVADLFAGTGPVHVAFAHLLDQTGGDVKAKDPYLDMVVASTGRSEVAVFIGQKNWGLQQEQIMPVGLAPSSVSVQDVNGDGIPDLVVTCAGTNSIWILRGLGNGRFDDKHPLILSTGQEPVGAYTGDFTGDGRTDLITLDRGSNGLTYYKNSGGSFAPPQHLDSGGTGPTAAVVRDVNGDGTSDLIVANRDDGRVTVFYGSPSGLHAGQTIERAGSHPSALAAGPGTQPSNQVFVLYENEDHAEIEVAHADGEF